MRKTTPEQKSNMNVVVRKAKVTDVPIVIKLLEKTNFMTERVLYNTPDYFKRSVKEGIFFVAEIADKGIVGLIHGENLMCDGAVIWYFMVDEKYRGKGIGQELLTHFEDYCRKKKMKWIFGSSDINDKTINFYQRNEYHFAEKCIEFTKAI